MVCKITDRDVTKKVELSGKCFEHGPALDREDFVRALCPDTSGDLIEKLVTATDKFAFGKIVERYDEYCLFRRQYEQICQVACRERGLEAFELYRKYKPIVEAAVLKLLTETGTEEIFFGNQAYGANADRFTMRQIQTDTFGIAAADRTYSTGGVSTAGNPFHVVPRHAVGVDPSVYTTTVNEQMLLIFYYQSDLGPRVLESISEYINDSVEWRVPFDIYSQLQRGDMGIVQRPGCLIVGSNKKLDINAWALKNDDVDILPQGVEIVKRKLITELK